MGLRQTGAVLLRPEARHCLVLPEPCLSLLLACARAQRTDGARSLPAGGRACLGLQTCLPRSRPSPHPSRHADHEAPCRVVTLSVNPCCGQVVEARRRGAVPRAAAEHAIARIAARVPGYTGALVAVDPRGRHAGAAFGRAAMRMATCMASAARAVLPRRVCLAGPWPYARLCCCGWPAEPLRPRTKRCTSTGHIWARQELVIYVHVLSVV